MRVYQSGKVIPMGCVTWDVMSSPRTMVTEEDPGVDFPPAVKKASREAPLRIAQALRAPRELIERFKASLSATSNARANREVGGLI